MPDAHDQRLTLHLVTHVPEHEPREDDPHYHLFEQVKARMKRQGLWKCVLNDEYCGGNVELHHSHIEFSQTNAIDFDRLNKQLGLDIDSDEEFQKWIESPGNLEPLCAVHHRTHFGIHVIPGPLWEPLRYRKSTALPAAEYVTAAQAGPDTVESTTIKRTTTRRRPTRTGTETDTKTDYAKDVKVTDEHHHVTAEHVEHTRSVDKQVVPRQRKKKGLLGRIFGGD
jgi:hypothetical protein